MLFIFCVSLYVSLYLLKSSFLPSSNQDRSQKKVSFISRQRILGTEVIIRDGIEFIGNSRLSGDDHELVMSVNELWQWKCVLPFSPALTGEFIE